MKWCFLLLVISVWKSSHQSPDVANSVIIESKKSGLVFDGNTDILRAVTPNASTGQRWTLEASPTGYFVITNVKTGKALDVESGCGYGHRIILYGRHGHTNQQFHIQSDGTIMACDKQFILKTENEIVKMVTSEEIGEIGDSIYQIIKVH